MTIHSPVAISPDTALMLPPEINEIANWLTASFGADAALWAELAVASLWRQGSHELASEWNAIRSLAEDSAPLSKAV